MKCLNTEIPDVKMIIPDVHGDERGYFKEVWNARQFAEHGLHLNFVQDNQSRSSRGILRGLHYQIRQPQGKLVGILKGAVFDVVVDLRRSSSTFGRWIGKTLLAEEHTLLWVPPGFAHGFYVISETAELAYKCTDFYAPEHERTLLWDDPDLNIDWPLEKGTTPRLSAKDARGARFHEVEYFP